MSDQISCDLCVIGGGSAGLSVAAGAAQMGANVVLIEGHKMGGDCLNYGCVPSKALLAAAKIAHSRRAGASMGIEPAEASVDFGAVKDYVAEVIAGIAPHDSVERFEGLGVTVLQDQAAFISPEAVKAGDRTVTARRFVIATGSVPMIPPIPGLEDVHYYTNETLFEARETPRHLLVIGGGPIGLEMAQAHRRLGCDVTVIEGARALNKDDPEHAAIVLAALRGEGIVIAEDALAERIVRREDGGIAVYTKDGRCFEGSHLLMAVGRRANFSSLGLEAAGVETSKAGIVVDAYLKTTNRRIYAIGDVTGGLQFTHVAGYQAGVVVRSALFGLPAKASTTHLPWATYTEPELAQVGLTEMEARAKHGERLEVLRFDMAENDRARAEGKTTGHIKVMVARGRPVGASIVGAQAGEQISLWALALANRLKISQVAGMVAPYPTLNELSKRAAGQYFVPRLFESALVKFLVRFVQRF